MLDEVQDAKETANRGILFLLGVVVGVFKMRSGREIEVSWVEQEVKRVFQEEHVLRPWGWRTMDFPGLRDV